MFKPLLEMKHMEPSPENEEQPLPLDDSAIVRTAYSLYLQDTERQVVQRLIDHTNYFKY
jgi:hypothetical protein